MFPGLGHCQALGAPIFELWSSASAVCDDGVASQRLKLCRERFEVGSGDGGPEKVRELSLYERLGGSTE